MIGFKIKRVAYLGILFTFKVWGLVPLESALLGRANQEARKENLGPIEYIFDQSEEKNADEKGKIFLGTYRGFYQDGAQLKNSCQQLQAIEYSRKVERRDVKQSLVSTLQFIGLDTTIRAFAKYARHLDYSEEKFKRAVDNMVGSYCSENISVIGVRQIKKNFSFFFENHEKTQIPSFEGREFFAQNYDKFISKEQRFKLEMFYTAKLFQAFCSWNGSIDNYRLLVPLITNPVVYASIVRKFLGQKIDYTVSDQKAVNRQGDDNITVRCQNHICRRRYENRPLVDFPRSIGHVSYQNDFSRLYCEDFRKIDYSYKGQNETILKIIKKTTFDEQNLMVATFVSLLTGVPDLMVWSNDLKEAGPLLRAHIDWNWDRWAREQIKRLKTYTTFEEPMVVELVEHRLHFDSDSNDLKIVFDVNVGEFDRINELYGKLKVVHRLKIKKRLLVWAKKQLASDYAFEKKTRDMVKKALSRRLEKQIEQLMKNQSAPIWGKNPTELIVGDLILQIEKHGGRVFDRKNLDQDFPLEIVLNYSPFALKYIALLREVGDLESQEKQWEKWQEVIDKMKRPAAQVSPEKKELVDL